MIEQDGARDFDFLLGDWCVTHRRLVRRLVKDSDWVEFSGPASAQTILGGVGNTDEYRIDLPEGTYLGCSVRLFDRASQQWSIYWIDSRAPTLGPPVLGRFTGRRGLFFGDDTHNGMPIRVRFLWSSIPGTPYRWEQAFSTDEGVSWETNWTMTFTRAAHALALSPKALPTATDDIQ